MKMTKQERELIDSFRNSSAAYKGSLLALAKGCARKSQQRPLERSQQWSNARTTKHDDQHVIPVHVVPNTQEA